MSPHRFKMVSQRTAVFVLLASMALSTVLAEKKESKQNSTSEAAETVENRKFLSKHTASRTTALTSALSGSGSSGGGGGGLQMIQQGLKGIQTIQKLVSNFGSVMRLPFSFRGVSDTMATLTGLLAAVGGGYLTYVSMVALFGNMLDPQGAYSEQQHQHAYFGPAQAAQQQQHHPHYASLPPGYGPGPLPNGGSEQGPFRRQSSGGLHFGSLDLSKFYHSVTSFNYPEASFKLLRIKDEVCKQRAVCELEKFLARKGIASVILKGVSKKITGMDKYLDAAYRGLSNEDCSFAYGSCPYTLGQTLLRTVGLN